MSDLFVLQSVNLATAVEKGHLVFVDVFSSLNPFHASHTPENKLMLRPKVGTLDDDLLSSLLTTLRDVLDKLEEENTIVILDDIAHLEWIGLSTRMIISFLRSLMTLCRKVRAITRFIHHADASIVDQGWADYFVSRNIHRSAHEPSSSTPSGSMHPRHYLSTSCKWQKWSRFRRGQNIHRALRSCPRLTV